MTRNKPDPKYRTTAVHIQVFMDREGITKGQLADAMHVSHQALHQWLKNNDAPSWTMPMLEGLIRRRKDTSIVFVAKLDEDHFQTVAKLINTLGGKVSAL